MNPWETLGIEPTDNKKLIKRAYAKKLKLYNPEDNEEKFVQLRAAYEKAIEEITRRDEEIQVEESIVDDFIKECKKLYSDFQKRIKVENWKKLFESELYERIYNDLNVNEEFNVKMLLFLGKYRNIPTEVWKFLNGLFFWTEREDLKNYFTSDYISYIINRIISIWDLGYEAFIEDKDIDYDKFIEHRYNAQIYLCRFDFENAREEINIAKSIFDKDPYLIRIEGQYYICLNEISKAIESFSRLIKLLPNEIDGYIKRGFLFKKQGNMELAYKDFEKVLDIDNNNLEAKGAIGEYYTSIREYEKAKEVFEELLKHSPNKINWRIYLAEIEWRKVKDIEDDAKNNPTIENKIKLINLYYEKEDYKLCEEEIYKMLDSGVVEKEFYRILGFIKKNCEEERKAIEYFDKYLELCEGEDDSTYEVIKEIGLIYSKLEEYGNAIERFNLLLEINPKDDFVLVEVADAYRYLKKYRKGIRYCNDALEINKDNWLANSVRGLCLYNLDEYKRSLEDHNIVVKSNPTFGSAWFRKAYCHMKLEEYEESLEAFKKAEENGDDWSYFNIAYLHFRKGDIEEAKKNVEKYIDAHDDYAIGYVLLGDIYKLKGSYHRALECYNKANELYNNYTEYHMYVGYTYLALKDYKNALDNIVKFINKDCKDLNIVLDAIWIAIQCEDFNVARQCIKKYESLVEVEPEKRSREYNMYKGMVLYNLDYKRKAALEFEEAINKEVAGEPFLYLAMIFLEDGKKEEAEKLCKKAIELEPNNSIYQEKLTVILETEIQKSFLGIFKKKNFIKKLEVDKTLRHTMYKLDSMVFGVNL